MAKVTVMALGSVRDALGWDKRDVDVADGGKVQDVLQAVPVAGSGSLRDLVACSDTGGLRPDKWIRVNGTLLKQNQFETEVKDGDQILLMDVIILSGG